MGQYLSDVKHSSIQSWPRGGLSSWRMVPTTRNLTAPPTPKQHIRVSVGITNELRKPWEDVLRTLSVHGHSKLWWTSLSMNKPITWCKFGRLSLVSSSCLYKTQPERALAQVCHTRIDPLSLDEYQFHLLLHRNPHHSQATDGWTVSRSDRGTEP